MVNRQEVDYLFDSMKEEFKEGPVKKSEIKVTLLRDCIEKSRSEKQRIVFWSPVASSILWYVKHTVPMASISDECRVLIEAGLKEKYPDIYKAVLDEMGKVD